MADHVAWDEILARELIEARAAQECAIAPVLHAVQDRFGYVHTRAAAMVANALNRSRAEVFGALAADRTLRRQPPLDSLIRLCLAESCRARGAEALAAFLETRYGARIDGGACLGVRIETALCLGHCDAGPNAAHDGDIFFALDPQTLDLLFAKVAAKAGAPP
ncbi:MAG TPA: NAD(P)H-dependent oxidoreductase subunit E [Rhodoblastus sp.]|nr:NAD(P)H-dependent oxidoreductase subunit E [Rhodoblastus sp.]